MKDNVILRDSNCVLSLALFFSTLFVQPIRVHQCMLYLHVNTYKYILCNAFRHNNSIYQFRFGSLSLSNTNHIRISVYCSVDIPKWSIGEASHINTSGFCFRLGEDFISGLTIFWDHLLDSLKLADACMVYLHGPCLWVLNLDMNVSLFIEVELLFLL